jgi:hypothetical protein
MPMERSNIHLGRCYRDTFGAVYKVEGYDGNEVRYAVYDLTHPGKLIELQHSQSWADFLADLESEIGTGMNCRLCRVSAMWPSPIQVAAAPTR